MSISYTYKITGMSAYPTADNLTNVVFQVNWSCIATDGTTSSGTFGSVPVQLDPADPFIPYADLTEAEVWSWIDPSIDRNQVEIDLAESIAKLQNPTVINTPLPWIK